LWPSGSTHTRYGAAQILSRKTLEKIKIPPKGMFDEGYETIEHDFSIEDPDDSPGLVLALIGNALFFKRNFIRVSPGKPAGPRRGPSRGGRECFLLSLPRLAMI
jgi:hypothetical protein